MRHSNARRIGLWSRSNLFDGWQVLGTIGLLAAALVFGLLITHGKPSLPSTGATIQLLQTLVSRSPLAQPTAEPTPTPSPSASPSPEAAVPATGLSDTPIASASRSGGSSRRPAPSPSQPAVLIVPGLSPLPTVSATPLPPRPCLYALCPSPSPTP